MSQTGNTEDACTVDNYTDIRARVVAAAADAYDNNSLNSTLLTRSQRYSRYSSAVTTLLFDADLPEKEEKEVYEIGTEAARKLAYDGDYVSRHAREDADELENKN